MTYERFFTKNGIHSCVCQFFFIPLQRFLTWRIARVGIEDLKILFGEHPELAAVRKALAHNNAHVLLSGLHASARALAIAAINSGATALNSSKGTLNSSKGAFNCAEGTCMFVIFDNAESAQYIYADLKTLGAEVGFFPSSKRRRTIDDAAVIQRTETLTTLPRIIVTYPEAVAEPVPAKEELSAVSFQLKVGQEVQLSPNTGVQ